MTDENIEQECPECGALCLFDDGNYVAIESIPVARPSTSNTTPSTQAVGEPDTVMHNGKDIVQIWFESNRDIFTFYDRITAPTTGSEPWQVGDDTSSVQISRDGSTHKWGCKCDGCAPTTGSALTFFEVGTTERGSALNTAIVKACQSGFTRGSFQWCSVFADALVALLAASMGGDRT